METLKIDKNVSVPQKRGKGSLMLTMEKMKVGDSFYIKGKTSQQISGLVNYGKLKLGIEAVMRTENGGVRVWRTK